MMIGLNQFALRELSSSSFPRTWDVLKKGLSDEVAPGFVVGLWEKSSPDHIQVVAVGHRRKVPTSLPMTIDTVFDLASVSKIMATAPLAATLVERGWLTWDTSLAAVFSGYPHPGIQIKHLLSHTAGYVFWEPFWEKIRNNFAPTPVYQVSIKKRQAFMRNMILSATPQSAPGKTALYSDISFLILAFALEEVTRMPFDQAVRELVWKRMGLDGPYYRKVDRPANQAIQEEVAATEDCPWRGGVLQGQVHDDNCWAMGGYAGHAGVFGTVSDVLYFSKKMMTGFFSPSVLKAMWTRVSQPEGCSRTLGWDTPSGDIPSASHRFSPHSVGHLGFTGTSLWIDPDAGLAVTLLSNRVHPSRENMRIREFRPQLHEAIRLDLGY